MEKKALKSNETVYDIILDIKMPLMDGLEVLRELVKVGVETRNNG